MRNVLAWVLIASVPILGCSLISKIDVCERSPHKEREVNARTEGTQQIGSPSALVAMPNGGAFVAFLSDASASPDDNRVEVRGTLIAPDGSAQPTCEQRTEYTFAPATSDTETFDFRSNPWVVPPQLEDGVGVIVYGHDDDETMQVMAVFIRGSACPYGHELEQVVISQETGPVCEFLRDDDSGSLLPDANCVVSPQAVPFQTANTVYSDFAVIWLVLRTSASGMTTTIRGRIVRSYFAAHEFLPVVGSADGSPLDLVRGGMVWAITTVPIADDRFVLIWQEQQGGELNILSTQMQIYDDRLSPVGSPVVIGEQADGVGMSADLDAAFDGERMLVAWTSRRDDENEEIVFRLLDAEGAPLDTGEPVPLSPSLGNQCWPTTTTLPDGLGFVVAWEAEGAGDHEDRSGAGVRAMALTAEGEPRFVNPSCDCTDFQLNDATEGRQYKPSIATLADGSVIASWTDDGTNGADLSGGSIRSVVFRPRDLLPLE